MITPIARRIFSVYTTMILSISELHTFAIVSVGSIEEEEMK